MKRFLTILAGIVVFAVMSAGVSAQNGYTVKGTVADQMGPVIGAAVVEAGTANGTVTDLDGNYVLKVSSADATVNVSFMGYVTATFKASRMSLLTGVRPAICLPSLCAIL